MDFVPTILAQNWLGTLIGLAGLVIAVHFYRASRVGARLAYQATSLRVIGGTEPELPAEVTVLFNQQPVPRVTKTVLVLWNSGTRTIPGEDIVAEDKLRISFDEGTQILGADVIHRTRQVNNFRVEKSTTSPYEATCAFDYLDAGDGVVVELLHTSSRHYPEVRGSVREIPTGVTDYGPLPREVPIFSLPFFRVISLRFFTSFTLVVGLAFVVIGLLSLGGIVQIVIVDGAPHSLPPWTVIVLGLPCMIPGLFLLWATRRRFPRALSLDI